MQHILVRWRENGRCRKEIKIRSWGKNEKGEKGGKLLQNGGKGLKNASFWVINSKIFARGYSDPPGPKRTLLKSMIKRFVPALI